MFYSTTDGQYINEGTQFTIDSVTYPPQWLNQATAEQKVDIGLKEVVAINSPKSDQYYWVSQTLDGATLTYVNTPKDLDTVKATALAQIDATAYSILQPNDWIDTRNLRDPSYKPEWITWRESIRQTAKDTVTAINACVDVDAVEAVMANVIWANDPNYVEPVETTEVI